MVGKNPGISVYAGSVNDVGHLMGYSRDGLKAPSPGGNYLMAVIVTLTP